MKDILLRDLQKVENYTSYSKFKKLLLSPIRYPYALYRRYLLPKISNKTSLVSVDTFFGTKMTLSLPSGNDLFLAGGKTHDSEIRLARYMIMNMEADDSYVDIGAHYGYFSMLASRLVGASGKVFSFEASPMTYKVLSSNKCPNMSTANVAATDHDGQMTFYEFPNLYSEYNSFDIEQYKGQAWLTRYQPKEISIPCTTLTTYFRQNNCHPKMIKIDVEGGEHLVVAGLKDYLQDSNPTIAMEYLSTTNTRHSNAATMLYNLGYSSWQILRDGTLKSVPDIGRYLTTTHKDSDNIIFKRAD